MSAKNRSIVVFEDDPISASLLKTILSKHGFRIAEIASSATELDRLCTEHVPDMVLMDIHLEGEISGVDAAVLIHQKYDIPLIFVSGESSQETFEAAKRANPVSFIVKPYSERQLISVLELAEQNTRLRSAVSEQNLFLSALFNASSDGILLVDRLRRTILDANPAAVRLFEKSRGSAIEVEYHAFTGGFLPESFFTDSNEPASQLIFRESSAGGLKVLKIEKKSVFETARRKAVQWRVEDQTAQHFTETRLRLMSEALEQSSDAIIITEANLDYPGPRIEYVNAAFTKTTGYSREEVLGKSPRLLQGPLSNKAILKNLKATLHSGGSFTGETVNYRKDKSTYNLEWNIAPIKNDAGEITHFVSVQRDITEQLIQDKKLRENESTLRSILESSLQAYFLVDPEHRVLAFNRVGAAFMHEIFGVSPGLQESLLKYLPEADQKRLQKHVDQAISGQKSTVERLFENDLGIGKWFRLVFAPVYDDRDTLLGISISAEEITAEKSANEEKELLLKRLQGTLNASTDGVIMIDSYGSIMDVNQSAEMQFGILKDDFADLDFWKLFPNTNFQVGDQRTVQHITAHDSSPLVEEVEAHRPDGKVFEAEISVSTYNIESRLFHTVFVRDITVRKQAAQTLAKERDLLDLIFKTAFSPIMLVNRQMDVLFANPRAIDYFHLEWNSARGIYQFPNVALFTEDGTPTTLLAATTIPEDAKTLPKRRFSMDLGENETVHFILTGSALDLETRVLSTLDVTKDTEYLLALEESEVRFRSMADSAPVLIWMTGTDHAIQYLNKTWYDFVRKQPEDSAPKSLESFIHPDDASLYRAIHEQALHTRSSYSAEFRLLHYSGEYRWVADYGSPRISADGSFNGYIGCTIDIHNEKTIRKQNSELAERVKTITRHIPGFIYQMKADGAGKLSFPFTSEGFERIFGFPGKAVVHDATPVLGLIHPDDRAVMAAEFSSIHETPVAHTRQFRVVVGGKIRWLESSASPDLISDGTILWNGYINDITERKEAAEQLKENEERFRAMFDRSSVIMALVEPISGSIMDVNPAAAAFYGYSVEELRTMQSVQINAADPEIVKKARQDALLQLRNDFEFVHRLKSGELRTVEVHSSPIVLNDKPMLYLIIHDITERKMVEAELKRQRELLQTLIDNIPDTIYVKDRQFRKILANKAELKYSGFATPEEILGKDDEDIYGFPGRQTIEFVERGIIEEGKSIINSEDSFINHHGEKFYFLTTKIPLRNAENEIVGLIGIGKNITERKEMELKLEEKNREFEAIFNAVPDLFFSLDKNGIINRFYAGSHANLFRKPEEFLGRPLQETLPEPVASQTLNAIQQALASKSLQSFEYSSQVGETILYFESNVYPLNENEVIAVVRDITQRKTAEVARQTSDSRMRALIDSQTNYVIRTDLAGRFLYCNRKFEEDFGWVHVHENGILGQDSMDSVVDEHKYRVADTMQRCFAEPNRVFQVEVDKPRRDGRRRTTLWDFICLTGPDGLPTEVQCIGIDISERKAAEEALVEERRQLELILNNMSGGVLMLDKSGNLAFANDSAKEILKNPFSGISGMEVVFDASITTDRDGKRYTRDEMPLEMALQHGVDVRNKLFKIQWNDGSFRWITVSATPIRNAAGAIVSSVSSFTDVTVEMQADERLRESEFRFKSLVEDAPVFILLGENNQFASYVNHAFRKFLGVEKTELSAEEYISRIHPDDFIRSGTANLEEFDKAVQLEYRLKNAEGVYRTLAFNIIPRADRQPGVRRYLVTATDITAIRDAEKTLRDNNFVLEELVAERTRELTSLNLQLLSEIKQRNSAELQREEVKRQLDVAFSQIESINTNINEAVYRSTSDRLVYANRAMAGMFGFDSVEDILKVPISELYPKREDRGIFLRKVIAEQRWQNYEHLMRRKDGTLFPVLLSGAATFGADGNLIHIDGTMRDITSMKKTQEELAKKSHDLAEAQQLALLGYWTLNVAGNNLVWDAGLYSENGLDNIHPMPNGEHFSQHVSENDRTLFNKAVETALVDGDAEYAFTIDMNSRVTRYIRGQIRRAPPIGPEYSCVLFGISRDVTKEKISELELEKAREQAENLAKAKQQFLANMSHEIRTPINGIRGMTHLLGQSALDDEQSVFVQAIKTSSDTLLGIINDILDIAKIDAGKIVFEKAAFSLKTVVQSVAQIIEIKSRDKHLPLILHVDDHIPDMVSGDSLRLSQILTNLLDNAVKFTEKGHVQLKVELAGEQSDSWDVRFIVSDTGMGIPANRIQQIFELFEQSDSSITRKFGGTGLGLAIVKRLIEHQGGTLQVQSTVNKGSQFRFVLSFGKPKDFQYQKDTGRAIVPTRNMSHLRILVTDDNAINRLWATKLLKTWGCEILEAANGIEALEQLSRTHIDLILMDLYMPEMDGYEASRLIRTDLPHPKSAVPIIALTADVLDDQEKRVRDAGIDAWLGKPFDPAELHQLILQLTVQRLEAEAHFKKMEEMQRKTGSLNFEKLEEIAGGDLEFIQRLVSEFRSLTAEVLVELKSAIENEQLDDIRKLVHKTKPNLEYFGADEEFRLADVILKQFKSQPSVTLNDIREPLMNLLDRLDDIYKILLESTM